MVSCDCCADIQAQGEHPACVAACPMRVIEFDDVDELIKAYEGYMILEEFPAQKALGVLRSNSVYVIKECMLDEDFDQAIL